MADIKLIEAQLAEARQQTATAQRQLEDRLLENNGAEDEETASLRAVADLYRSREASLVRVRVAAQRANTAAVAAPSPRPAPVMKTTLLASE